MKCYFRLSSCLSLLVGSLPSKWQTPFATLIPLFWKAVVRAYNVYPAQWKQVRSSNLSENLSKARKKIGKIGNIPKYTNPAISTQSTIFSISTFRSYFWNVCFCVSHYIFQNIPLATVCFLYGVSLSRFLCQGFNATHLEKQKRLSVTSLLYV